MGASHTSRRQFKMPRKTRPQNETYQPPAFTSSAGGGWFRPSQRGAAPRRNTPPAIAPATARSPVSQARKINTQKAAVRKPAVMATRLFIETGAGADD